MSTLPAAFVGLVDDAAVFPPGDAPLLDAVAAFVSRRQEWFADLVGSFVVRDVDVPSLGSPLPVSVVVAGGAGALGGAVGLVARHGHTPAGVEIALRDLDDLPGNARRVVAAVDAARGEGRLGDDVPVFVEIPGEASAHAWAAAADEVAAAELRLKLRTGGLEARLFPAPSTLAAWIDGALDRETPFKCTAGLHRALPHTADDGFDHHGFLTVLLATRLAFDGAGRDDVVDVLGRRDADAVVALAHESDLSGARRWLTSIGSCSVTEPLDDLLALGLAEPPPLPSPDPEETP